MDLIKEAKKINNGHSCIADIDLMVKVLGKLGESPTVVMLGAGSNFMLTVFGAKPKALLYSVDKDEHAHWWEQAAKENLKVVANHAQVLGDSVAVAKSYKGPKVDLLIVDSNHSEKGVAGDLNAWAKHMNKNHVIFCHDYNAKKAPHFYPGVKKACDKFFKESPTIAGWSAVWEVKKK